MCVCGCVRACVRACVCVKELKNDSLTCGSNRDRSLENTTSVPATDPDLFNCTRDILQDTI